jgi:enoyl-CoA hydratase
MGGGVGLSVHGRHRVVSERAVLAMPESAIGYFPDVGGSYLLPRMPGRTGHWLGLTGHRLTGGDNVHLGWATHFVRSERFGALFDALVEPGMTDVEATLARFAEAAPVGEASAEAAQADQHFASWDLNEVARSLRADSRPFALRTLAQLRALSPHSMRLTLQLMQAGAASTLAQCLERELEAAESAVQHPDFAEGVRAVLVDKDRNPRWQQTFDEATTRPAAS